MHAHTIHRCITTAAPWLLLGLCVSAAPVAEAARGGQHGGYQGGARASAHTSINRPAAQGYRSGQMNRQRPSTARVPDRNIDRNINRDVNRNINRNVNRDIDIDVDVDDHDRWNDWDDHPFATAAAVTAGVALTSAVIGSIVYSVPPSCMTTIVNGIAYQQCGSTWYQPQYYGTTVQYIVVNPPG